MSVTTTSVDRPRSALSDDPHRLALTAPQLVTRAIAVIEELGYDPEGFGRVGRGRSLHGAVYTAAGFYAGAHDLTTVAECSAHRLHPATPCEAGCEWPLWAECGVVIAWLAETLRTPPFPEPARRQVGARRQLFPDPPPTPVGLPRLTRVAPSDLDYADVQDANRLLSPRQVLGHLLRIKIALEQQARDRARTALAKKRVVAGVGPRAAPWAKETVNR